MGRRGLKHIAARDGDLLGQIRVVLEEYRRRHHLGDAGNRALALRVLFPEDLIRFRVIDDRRGGTDIRHEVAARVDLVAWQDRVGHFARHRDCARTSQRQLPRLRARRRVNGPLARRLDGRRRFCGFGASFRRRVSRHDAETDHCRERKKTDPETCFSVHVECPGPVFSEVTSGSVTKNS